MRELIVVLAASLLWADVTIAQTTPTSRDWSAGAPLRAARQPANDPRSQRLDSRVPNRNSSRVLNSYRIAQSNPDFANPEFAPPLTAGDSISANPIAPNGELPAPANDADGDQSPAAEMGDLESGSSTGPREYRVPLRAPNLENIRMKSQDGLISLVARDGALGDIVTLLAETHGLNVVTADPLAVPITLTLDRVKLDDALDAVLSVAGYTWSMHKNIIFISNLATSSGLSPQMQGVQLEVFTLDYALAQDVNAAISGMLSPIGNSFMMTSSDTNSRQSREVVVVQDLPNFLDRIREYVAQVDLPPRQVLIEVHVLQVDLDASNKHGVNLDHFFRRNGSVLLEMHSTGLANPNAAQAFTFQFSDGNLGALLEMLKTTTDAKTLASPRLLVLNGQMARLQVGEQLGFRITTTTETSTTQSVDFIDVGVVLEVTPRISRDGRIMLSVRPEVSSGLVNPETGLPEEKTTELDTDVLLCDNEGIVIGGLIQESNSDVEQKLPVLGEIYLIGKLFKRKEAIKSRKEIIMALIPRLVPYMPAYDQAAAEKFMQAQTPLLQGPLEPVPRPWEPSFPTIGFDPWASQVPCAEPIIPSSSATPAATANEPIPAQAPPPNSVLNSTPLPSAQPFAQPAAPKQSFQPQPTPPQQAFPEPGSYRTLEEVRVEEGTPVPPPPMDAEARRSYRPGTAWPVPNAARITGVRSTPTSSSGSTRYPARPEASSVSRDSQSARNALGELRFSEAVKIDSSVTSGMRRLPPTGR